MRKTPSRRRPGGLAWGRMTLAAILSIVSVADLAALALLWAVWFGIGWRIEHPSPARPSVSVLMAGYRRAWMEEFARRESRIFDATLLGNLRQGTSFFASTCLLAIGAVLALIGNTDPLLGVAEELAGRDAPRLLWQVRLLPPVLFLAHAFLRFVWSHRVFGYASVMMGAVPQDPEDPRTLPRARAAAELNIRAAYNFNRGLRSMYVALAALGWLIGPLALALCACAVGWVLWSREFASVPRKVLLET